MERDDLKLARRSLLQLLPAALLPNIASGDGPHQCGASESPATPGTPYRYQFFSKEEAALFDSVAEHIIPADEHSPGAHEARVSGFADLMISTGPDYVKEDWRSGLQLLATELRGGDVQAWLEHVSANEDNPQTVLEIFFRTMKEMTINGYYTSRIGIHQDLKYQGNTYVTVFPGCEHPEHKV
jgi:gluconate 2-dehydrogenase subunit 3-like protein